MTTKQRKHDAIVAWLTKANECSRTKFQVKEETLVALTTMTASQLAATLNLMATAYSLGHADCLQWSKERSSK